MGAGVQTARELVEIASRLANIASRLAVEADADDLLPVADAAVIANCSVRTLTADARAEGWLFGRQRSRCVRRRDLDAWIESRKVKPVQGVADLDIARRMARLGGKRRTA